MAPVRDEFRISVRQEEGKEKKKKETGWSMARIRKKEGHFPAQKKIEGERKKYCPCLHSTERKQLSGLSW